MSVTNFRFRVAGASAFGDSVTPAIRFELQIRAEGDPVEAMLLRVRAQIEPWRRRYAAEERDLLNDLSLTRPLQFAEVPTMVGAFSGETTVDLIFPVGYDLRVAANKYFCALDEGEVPLRFFFNGTAFRAGERGFSVEYLPWSAECATSVPLEAWQGAMETCFPGDAWIGVRRETFEELLRYRAATGGLSWEETFAELLAARRAEEAV
jgi:hypothetical protein